MNKIPIAIYLQHYLAPSMTFIYRQLKSAEKKYDPLVLCSDRVENRAKFPFDKFFLKRRNFVRIKKSRYYNKLFGSHSLLSINPRISLRQSKFFSQILHKNDVKLIHAHFGPSGIEIVNLARALRIPLLVTFHGYDASLLLTMKKYIENIKRVFDYAHIITVSEKMKCDLIKFGAIEERVSVVRCGIPVDRFHYVERASLQSKFSNNEMITFLQVSNFVEVKGHKYTVLAFRDFLGVYPNANLILAGDGGTKASVQELCANLGISSKVKFPGVVDESTVIKLMKNADAFLHHSVTLTNGIKEGLPTVVMEAMATGLPVISTYHSAIPELIDDGLNGFLVKERDTLTFKDTMYNLKNVTNQIGLNARKKVSKDFNLEIETQKLFEIYDRLMLNIRR